MNPWILQARRDGSEEWREVSRHSSYPRAMAAGAAFLRFKEPLGFVRILEVLQDEAPCLACGLPREIVGVGPGGRRMWYSGACLCPGTAPRIMYVPA